MCSSPLFSFLFQRPLAGPAILLPWEVLFPLRTGQVAAGRAAGQVHQLAQPEIPQAGSAIPTAGDQPVAVGADGDGPDSILVAAQDDEIGRATSELQSLS